MTNNEVAQGFTIRVSGKAPNLSTDGVKLYSYRTCIAEWIKGKCVVNMTRYSTTSSHHRNLALRWLEKYPDVVVRLTEDIPIGIQSLKEYYDSDR